jgi:RNA polymerase sigma-70 factor (ECF subfamily)
MISEDIVMDSFMYYWERRSSIAPDCNIPAYILTEIKHKCLDYLKHLRIQEEAIDKIKNTKEWELNLRISTLEACNPDKLFSEEMRDIVNKAINNLPPQTRDIFIRSRYHEKSNKEIAEELNVSTKTIEYHITKALKTLRISLKDYNTCLFFL